MTDATELLREFLAHDDRRYRITAARGLLERQGLQSLVVFIDLLRENYRGVRSVAAWALGELGHPAAVEPLRDALGDDDSWTRRYAALSLGKLQAREARPALEALADDPDRSVRLVARWALRRLEDGAEEVEG